MEPIILIEHDKELAEILLGTSEETKKFNEKTNEEKIEFLVSTIKRAQHYLSMDEYAWNWNVDKDDMWGLGSHVNAFVHAAHVYTKTEYTYNIGWEVNHGSTFQFFENDGNGNIFVSYFTDGHPQKEFRQKWEFMSSQGEVGRSKIHSLEITNPNDITPIAEAIKPLIIHSKK